MRPTGWTVATVLILAAACTGQGEVPAISPPPVERQALLPAGSDDFAHRSFGSPLSVGDAEEILLRTEVFAFGGMPPKRQVHAFNVLFDQADAVARFQTVAERGHSAGRLYALCAFHLLAVVEAQRLAADLTRSKERLVVYDHDVGASRESSDVMAMLRDRELCEGMRLDRDETQRFFDKAG